MVGSDQRPRTAKLACHGFVMIIKTPNIVNVCFKSKKSRQKSKLG
jgi:hypothetical protein